MPLLSCAMSAEIQLKNLYVCVSVAMFGFGLFLFRETPNYRLEVMNTGKLVSQEIWLFILYK